MFTPSDAQILVAEVEMADGVQVRLFDDATDPLSGGSSIAAMQALALYRSGDHDLKMRDGEVHLVKLHGRMPLRFEIIPDL